MTLPRARSPIPSHLVDGKLSGFSSGNQWKIHDSTGGPEKKIGRPHWTVPSRSFARLLGHPPPLDRRTWCSPQPHHVFLGEVAKNGQTKNLEVVEFVWKNWNIHLVSQLLCMFCANWCTNWYSHESRVAPPMSILSNSGRDEFNSGLARVHVALEGAWKISWPTGCFLKSFQKQYPKIQEKGACLKRHTWRTLNHFGRCVSKLLSTWKILSLNMVLARLHQVNSVSNWWFSKFLMNFWKIDPRLFNGVNHHL